MTMPPPGALKAEDWQPDGKWLLRGTKRGERVHIDILSCVLSACATGAASSASPRTFRRLAAEQGSFALKRGMLPA
jgi:hypothetical protein